MEENQLFNKEAIEGLLRETLSKYINEDYVKTFISKVVGDVLSEKSNSWSSKTILEDKLIQTVREIVIQELEKILEENREKIRTAVRQMLEEKGLDVLIDRISRANASALVEALKVEAWIEK